MSSQTAFSRHAGNIALIVSIASGIGTVFTWHETSRLRAVTEKDSLSASKIVMTAESNLQNRGINFKPIDDKIKIQTIKIMFPTTIQDNAAIFSDPFQCETNPSTVWQYSDIMNSVVTKYQIELLKKSPLSPGNISAVGRFPIFVKVNYLVKGDKTSDLSIYFVKYQFNCNITNDGSIKNTELLIQDIDFESHYMTDSGLGPATVSESKPWTVRFKS